jgi:hypothetical protein
MAPVVALVKVTIVPAHTSVALDVKAAAGASSTVYDMGVDVAVAGLAQAAVDVIVTVTAAPLVKSHTVNVGLSIPAFRLSIFHW